MKAKALFGYGVVFALSLLLGYACGGEDSACPGKVCYDCASQDCSTGACPEGEVEFCGHFGYWPDDQTKRCSFCESPDFEP